MSLGHDLLEQARHLARRERGRPKQASLRRAISAAYYALYHHLREEAGLLAVPGAIAEMRALSARALSHGDVKKVSSWFIGGWGQLPDELKARYANPLPGDLVFVARVVVKLQQERHEADYNVERRFSRGEAVQLVSDVEAAFVAWNQIRSTAEARRYLVLFLLGDRWRR